MVTDAAAAPLDASSEHDADGGDANDGSSDDAATDDAGSTLSGHCRPGYYEGDWVGTWHAKLTQVALPDLDYLFGESPIVPGTPTPIPLRFLAERSSSSASLVVRNGCLSVRTTSDLSVWGIVNDLISGHLIALVNASWDCNTGVLTGTLRGTNGEMQEISGELSGTFVTSNDGDFANASWSALGLPQDPPDPTHGGEGTWQATWRSEQAPTPANWPAECDALLAKVADAGTN